MRALTREALLRASAPALDDPARVVRIDPGDGTLGVLRDAPVVARLSHPADPESLCDASFAVLDAEGPVPGRLRLETQGLVVVWHPDRLLTPGVHHYARCDGLRDRGGRCFASHLSRFVPCGLEAADLRGA